MKTLFKAQLIRLCSNVYLSSDNLQIYSVKPSCDNNRRHTLVVTYSNDETNNSKTNFYLEDSSDKEEFLNLLDEQIKLQQDGPLSDPNVVRWMK